MSVKPMPESQRPRVAPRASAHPHALAHTLADAPSRVHARDIVYLEPVEGVDGVDIYKTPSTPSTPPYGSVIDVNTKQHDTFFDSTLPRARASARIAGGEGVVKPPFPLVMSPYETALGEESLAKMARSFQKVSILLDDIWLRQTLRKVSAEFPKATETTVRACLRATFAQMTRAILIPAGQRGYVSNPREYARHVFRSEIERRKKPWA